MAFGTPRRCLQSETTKATQSDRVGDLARNGAEPDPEPEFKSDLDGDVSRLVQRLNYLKTLDEGQGSSKEGVYVIEEGLQMVEAGRDRGIKDLRVYKAACKLLSGSHPGNIARLVELMKLDGIAPDLEDFNLLLHGYVSRREMEAARRTYEELVASGLEPDGTTLSNMVVANSLLDVKEMARMFKLLREREMEPTTAAYESMISWFWREAKWRQVTKLVGTMLAEGITPTDAVFSVAFLAAKQLSDTEFSKMLLERHSEAGMPPRHDFFVSVMATLATAGKHKEVLEYWRRLVCVQWINVSIRPKTFLLVLRAAVRVKAWDEVKTIIGMMQEDKLPMNEKVHNVLMSRNEKVTTDEASMKRLLGILQQMEAYSGIGLTPMCKLQLAVLCSEAGMHDRAMPLFETAQRHRLPIKMHRLAALVETLRALGRTEEVRRHWDQATPQDKKEFTGSTYLRFMHEAQRLKDADWALELHAMSLTNSKQYPSWFHPLALEVVAEAGRLKEAFGIAETLRTMGRNLPRTTYSVLCHCCKQHGDKEVIVKAVQNMSEKVTLKHYLPPPDVLEFVVAAFTEMGFASEVLSMFDKMHAQRMQPAPEVYVLLADAAVAANNRSKAAHFVSIAEKSGLKPSARALSFAQDAPQRRDTSNAT